MAQVALQKRKKILAFVGPDSKVTFHANNDDEKILLIPKCSLDKSNQKYDQFGNAILGDCRCTDIRSVDSLSKTEQDYLLVTDDPYLSTVILLKYFLDLKNESELEYAEPENITSEPKPEPRKNIDDSRLASELSDLLEKISTKWNENMIDRKLDGWDELESSENRTIYLNEIVPLQAYELYETIQAMIEFEEYPKESFKEYESLWYIIQDVNSSPLEKAKALKKMAMIGASKIQAKTKYRRPITMTPLLNSTTSGSENLKERKVVRI